jgi:dephospho-CoA kinase
MLTVAVTGGIACGKSVVGRVLESEGLPVCEADAVAHRLMARGEPVFERVREEFGACVLDAAKEIDRRALGAIVFRDAAARARLNAIVHPAVDHELRCWVAARRGEAHAAAAVIVPLLFEAGMERGWDAIVCVSATEAVQMRRLLERGAAWDEASCRIASQWAVAQKAERADFVLVGNGAEELMREQVKRVLRCILEK